MKVNKILSIAVLLILLNTFYVFSYAEDRHEITISSPPHFYEGETKTIQAIIVNNNKRCDYSSCSWQAEGRSGSTGFISHGGGTETVSFQVTAPRGPPGYFDISISAVCYIPRSIYCWWDDELSDSAIAFYSYCGDNDCDSSESCSTCPSDCESCCGNGKIDPGEGCDGSNKKSCKDLGYDYGETSCSRCTLITSNCKRCNNECSAGQKVCVGDGYKTCQTDSNGCRKWSSVKSCGIDKACFNGQCIPITTNENCGAIGNRCAYNEECINNVCKPKCGNDRIDSGENCANCPQDVKCSSNQACSTSGQCIQLGTIQNCASVGDSCGTGFCINNKCVECRTTQDCVSKKGRESTGKYECSADRRGRYEILVEKGGQCINGKCTGSNEIKSNHLESCGDVPCYNGQCGCPEGYGTCKETWNCVKRGTILIGQPCDCDVQCESGFCKERKCVKTIDVTLSSTKASLKPGEETTVTLSVSSNLNDDVQGSATLNIGSGAEMVDIISVVGDCSGNQCKISGILPGRDRNEITVRLKSNSEVSIPISADVSYKVEGQDVQIRKSSSVEFTESKKKKKEGGGITTITGNVIGALPNIPKNYLIGGVVAIALILILIFYFIGKKHKPTKKKDEKNEKEKKKEEKAMYKGKEESKEEKQELSGSIAKEIEHLHALMKKGIITKKEFKDKKKEVLKKKL